MYIYSSLDERLIAIRDDGQRTYWTVRGLDGRVLKRDERIWGGVLLTGFVGLGDSAPVPLAPCPGGTPSTRVFCDGFETGNMSGWSTASQGASRRVTNYVWRDSQLVGSDVI